MSATTISLALELMISLLSKSAEIGALINKAQTEGRTELNDEEWNAIIASNDEARSQLAEAIGKRVLAKLNEK
jgi:hypothetical protein